MKITFEVRGGIIEPHSYDDLISISEMKDGIYQADLKNMDMRTAQQNRAMHKYFSLVAKALNESGQDIKHVIKADVPWTMESVKEIMWKGIQEAILNKRSTTKLTKDEIDKVFDVMNRVLGERCGVHVPFPNKENLQT